jgi:serine/threonine-protein kinase
VPSIATRETIGAPLKAATGEPAGNDSPDRAVTANQVPVKPEQAELDQPEREAPPSRFTTLEEAQREQLRQQASGFRDPRRWWKPAGLFVLLGLIVWFVLAALWPPSAERLFRKLSRAAEDETAESLLQVESDIDAFLERFPKDPRASQVRAWQEEIELYRLARTLERQAQGRRDNTPLTPVERAYLEAIEQRVNSPEAAVVKLEAIVSVFDASTITDQRARRCVELARRDLIRLRAEIGQWSKEHLKSVIRQLDRADAIEANQPETAEAIRRGVVELYGNKPWAAEAVKRARRDLSTSETSPE